MGAIAGFLGVALPEVDMKKLQNAMERRCPYGRTSLPISGGRLLRNGKPREYAQCYEGFGECFTMVFSGRLDNRESLRKELTENGMDAACCTDAGLLLRAYALWRQEAPGRLKGPFAFAVWEEKAGRLFFARDQLGMEPLFFSCRNQNFVFASEIKSILALPGFSAQLDRQGAAELLLLGPGRKPGSAIFRGIQALEPGWYGIYEQGRMKLTRYWSLRDREHREVFQETADHIRQLVLNAIHSQLEPDMGTFLSGGLDSSIISAVCAESLKVHGKPLKTFSVDYENNSRYFRPGKFQPDSDEAYIAVMVEAMGSRHCRTVLTAEDLCQNLHAAVEARDLPGMGDVDTSLLIFCREIRKRVPAALSGECADELFGGYPWYREPEIRDAEGFPWARNTAQRGSLLGFSGIEPENFIREVYTFAWNQAEVLPETKPEEARIRRMMHLNIQWFMQTLLERNDRMCGGLEVRVPFCDWELAEYLYSVPWSMKDYGNREKGLLRYAVRDLLPEKVRLRKKSPYPKTFDPHYEQLVTKALEERLREDRALWHLVNRKTVRELLLEDSSCPWYGQLMKQPQIIAFLLQIDHWLEHYQVEMLF